MTSSEYVFCSEDAFWYRPLYTDGKCPLCGDAAPGGAAPPPLLARVDGFSAAMAAVGLLSVGMTALVLVMYFQA